MSGTEVAAWAAIGLQAADSIVSASNQAAAQRQQAVMAQSQADRERAIAVQQAEDFRRRQADLLASRRARRAASGVALAGSPLLADDAAERDILLNQSRILAGGANRASDLEAKAVYARDRASEAIPLGLMRAGTTLLRGFGR
jgi:hypothetical protein